MYDIIEGFMNQINNADFADMSATDGRVVLLGGVQITAPVPC
jgi:hypothetical protein